MNDVQTIKSRVNEDGTPPAAAEVLFQHLRQYNVKDIVQFGFPSPLDTLYVARAVKTTGGRVVVVEDPPTSLGCVTVYGDTYPDELAPVGLNTPFDNAGCGLVESGQMFDAVYVNLRHCPTWYKVALSVTFANALLRPGGWLILNGYEDRGESKVQSVWNHLVMCDPRYWNHIYIYDFAMTQKVRDA